MFGFFGIQNEKEKKTSDVLREEAESDSFTRFDGNPIIRPNSDLPWKARAVYNPAVLYLDEKVHFVYRGQAMDGVSSFGYAVSRDGYNIDEDLSEPIYSPSKDFEFPTKPGWNSGCEDPRMTIIGSKIYMTYTAYDGTHPPRVALTSISVEDFLRRNFSWSESKLISPPGVDDKDACIIRNERMGLIAFHRLGNALWIDTLKDLEFPQVKFLTGGILATARENSWDNIKIGLAGPPIETDAGLLLFYHALCNPDFSYKIGAMLLDYSNPHKILARSNDPLLSPEMDYEINGQIHNAVFSCGTVVIKGKVFMYYGGGDTVTCLATVPLKGLVDFLLSQND